MIIYSNGCSHTAGHCEPRTSHVTFTCDYIMNFYSVIDIGKPGSKLQLNYQSYINQLFDDTLVFEATNGKSNDRIFFETYNFISFAIENKLNIDYAIIQWSGVNRTFNIDSNGKVIDINPYDNYELGLKFEPMATSQTIQYMYILQELFNYHDIKYVFIPYMELDLESYNKFELSKNLDLEKFTSHPTIGHRNLFLKDKKLICDSAGHPSKLGAKKLSEMSIKILEKQCKGINKNLKKRTKLL